MLLLSLPMKGGECDQCPATGSRSRKQLSLLHSVFPFIFCIFYFEAMGLTPKVTKMCGCSNQMCCRSVWGSSSSVERVKSPRLDGMERALARRNSIKYEHDGIRISRRDWTGSDVVDKANVHGGVDVKVDRRKAGVAYCSSALVLSVRLDLEAAWERTQRTGSFEWDSVDVMAYVEQREFLHFHHFGTFPVERQVGREAVNGKSQMTMCGAWNMHMPQWRKPAVHRVQVELEVSCFGDWGDWIYVIMVDNLIQDHINCRTSRPRTIPYCRSHAPYSRLSFMSWSRIWPEAVKYEASYRVGDFDGYFVGWHNQEYFMISLDEREKPFVCVPDW